MVNRRSVITHAVAAFGALQARRVRAEAPRLLELCSWQRVGTPYCSNGTKWQKWFYRCCEASGCDDVSCELRPIGPC